MARRSAGEGSICRRESDGRWQAAVQLDGVRKTVYGKTRAEVVAKLDGLRRTATETGALPDPGRRTFGDLLDEWLAQVGERCRPTTLANYRCVAERHVRPALGKLPLGKLGPERLARLYRLVAKEGERLPALVHVVCRGACRLGVTWRWLAHDPTEHLRPPTYRAPSRGVWTREELVRFQVGSREHWLSPLWRFLLASGLRLGEATALRWSDCDLEAATVHVSGTLTRLGGTWAIGQAKTGAALRTVALPVEGVAALKRQRAQQAEWRLRAGRSWQPAIEGLAFTNREGWPLHRATAAHALERTCAKLGLPILTAHGLRRQHISLALEAGAGVAAVARRVGHSDPKVTWQSYARAVSTDADVAAVVERALSAGGLTLPS